MKKRLSTPIYSTGTLAIKEAKPLQEREINAIAENYKTNLQTFFSTHRDLTKTETRDAFRDLVKNCVTRCCDQDTDTLLKIGDALSRVTFQQNVDPHSRLLSALCLHTFGCAILDHEVKANHPNIDRPLAFIRKMDLVNQEKTFNFGSTPETSLKVKLCATAYQQVFRIPMDKPFYDKGQVEEIVKKLTLANILTEPQETNCFSLMLTARALHVQNRLVHSQTDKSRNHAQVAVIAQELVQKLPENFLGFNFWKVVPNFEPSFKQDEMERMISRQKKDQELKLPHSKFWELMLAIDTYQRYNTPGQTQDTLQFSPDEYEKRKQAIYLFSGSLFFTRIGLADKSSFTQEYTELLQRICNPHVGSMGELSVRNNPIWYLSDATNTIPIPTEFKQELERRDIVIKSQTDHDIDREVNKRFEKLDNVQKLDEMKILYEYLRDILASETIRSALQTPARSGTRVLTTTSQIAELSTVDTLFDRGTESEKTRSLQHQVETLMQMCKELQATVAHQGNQLFVQSKQIQAQSAKLDSFIERMKETGILDRLSQEDMDKAGLGHHFDFFQHIETQLDHDITSSKSLHLKESFQKSQTQAASIINTMGQVLNVGGVGVGPFAAILVFVVETVADHVQSNQQACMNDFINQFKARNIATIVLKAVIETERTTQDSFFPTRYNAAQWSHALVQLLGIPDTLEVKTEGNSKALVFTQDGINTLKELLAGKKACCNIQ